MTTPTRCRECGGRMIYVGYPDHASCDPQDADAARIREQHTAYLAGIAGTNQAAANSPDDYALALAILNRAALSQQVVSANDLRNLDARWERLESKVRGSAFRTAARRGWITRIGYEESTSKATHGHDLKTWHSEIYVDQFKAGLVSVGIRKAG